MTLWLTIALYAVAGGIILTVLTAALRSGHPVRRLGASGVQGLCALGLVDLLGSFTGVSLGFSWFTLGVCGVLGFPGVVALLLLRLLFSV